MTTCYTADGHKRPVLNVDSQFLIYIWNVPNRIPIGLIKRSGEKFGRIKFVETFEAWQKKRIGQIIIEFADQQGLDKFVQALSQKEILTFDPPIEFRLYDSNFGQRKFFEYIREWSGVDLLGCRAIPESFDYNKKAPSNASNLPRPRPPPSTNNNESGAGAQAEIVAKSRFRPTAPPFVPTSAISRPPSATFTANPDVTGTSQNAREFDNGRGQNSGFGGGTSRRGRGGSSGIFMQSRTNDINGQNEGRNVWPPKPSAQQNEDAKEEHRNGSANNEQQDNLPIRNTGFGGSRGRHQRAFPWTVSNTNDGQNMQSRANDINGQNEGRNVWSPKSNAQQNEDAKEEHRNGSANNEQQQENLPIRNTGFGGGRGRRQRAFPWTVSNANDGQNDKKEESMPEKSDEDKFEQFCHPTKEENNNSIIQPPTTTKDDQQEKDKEDEQSPEVDKDFETTDEMAEKEEEEDSEEKFAANPPASTTPTNSMEFLDRNKSGSPQFYQYREPKHSYEEDEQKTLIIQNLKFGFDMAKLLEYLQIVGDVVFSKELSNTSARFTFSDSTDATNAIVHMGKASENLVGKDAKVHLFD